MPVGEAAQAPAVGQVPVMRASGDIGGGRAASGGGRGRGKGEGGREKARERERESDVVVGGG